MSKPFLEVIEGRIAEINEAAFLTHNAYEESRDTDERIAFAALTKVWQKVAHTLQSDVDRERQRIANETQS